MITHHDDFDLQAAEVHSFQHLQLSALHIQAPQVNVSNAHPAGAQESRCAVAGTMPLMTIAGRDGE
jgi:hypothetical protein